MENSIIADYYEPLLTDNHFIPADDNNSFNSAGQCWRLSHEFGEGFYWVYAKKDLYDIKIHDFYFHDDFFMEFNLPVQPWYHKADTASPMHILCFLSVCVFHCHLIPLQKNLSAHQFCR